MGYGEITLEDTQDVGLFALPSFLIVLRETLEAAIVVCVLISLLNRIEMPQLKRYVWMGVGLASALCIAGAVIMVIVINVVKETVLEDGDENIVEGAVSIIAAVLIGIVALSIGDISAIQDKIEHKIAERLHMQDSEVKEGAIVPADLMAERAAVVTKELIFFLSFTAVAREGLETIIFFVGIGASFPPESLPIPAVVGLLVGIILGVLLYKSAGKLTIKWFFRLTMALLVFIGAGVWTNGMHELQEAGKFGVWVPEEARAPINQEIFDISDCCGLDNEFWVLMRVLFGYQPNPTPLEFIMYFVYQVVVWTLIFIKFWRVKHNKPGYKALIKYYVCRKPIEPVGQIQDAKVEDVKKEASA